MLLTLGGVLHAESAQNCIGDYETGQSLRRDGHYQEALAKFGACASAACPSAISLECVAWASKLDAASPRIVVRAQDERERALSGVRVFVDGVERQPIPGSSEIQVDPGEHVVRGEAPGHAPAEGHVEVPDDPRGRLVVLVLRTEVKPGTPIAQVGVAPPEQGEEAPHGNTKRVLAYVFGGVGIAAMGGFAYFGLSGMHDKHELDTCKPYCDPSRVDSARLKLTLADVSLGVGIASLGAAVWLYVVSRDDGGAHTQVGVMPLPGGVAATALTRF